MFCKNFFAEECASNDFVTEKFKSDDFRSVCNLLSNKDKFEGSLAEGLKYTALKLSTLFASLWNEDSNLADQDSGDLKDLVAHMICVVQANGFTVSCIKCLNLIT